MHGLKGAAYLRGVSTEMAWSKAELGLLQGVRFCCCKVWLPFRFDSSMGLSGSSEVCDGALRTGQDLTQGKDGVLSL